jgi:hypothetical protein
MSYLVSNLFTRVQHKLDDNSFDTGVLLEFLNDTEREIFHRYRLNQNETQYDSVTTTAASRSLSSLPTSPAVQTYISLRIILPVNYSRVIPYVAYEDADVYYPNYQLLGQGTPIAWYTFDGTPTLLNNADQIYTISAKYVGQPGTLTSANDTPNIPEQYSELAVLGMYARALEFNDEFDEAQKIRAQFNRLATDYVDSTRRTAGTPHIMRNVRTINRNIRIR